MTYLKMTYRFILHCFGLYRPRFRREEKGMSYNVNSYDTLETVSDSLFEGRTVVSPDLTWGSVWSGLLVPNVFHQTYSSGFVPRRVANPFNVPRDFTQQTKCKHPKVFIREVSTSESFKMVLGVLYRLV